MSARIFIDGEAGTTGLGIRTRLAERPDIDLLSLPADARKDEAAKTTMLRAADLVVLCLPDEAARATVALVDALGPTGPRVLDASTAHRVAPGWAYGFPETGSRAGCFHQSGKAGRQSRLLCDGRDRAPAAACRCRSRPVRFRGQHQCRLGVYGRRQVDDRRLSG